MTGERELQKKWCFANVIQYSLHCHCQTCHSSRFWCSRLTVRCAVLQNGSNNRRHCTNFHNRVMVQLNHFAIDITCLFRFNSRTFCYRWVQPQSKTSMRHLLTVKQFGKLVDEMAMTMLSFIANANTRSDLSKCHTSYDRPVSQNVISIIISSPCVFITIFIPKKESPSRRRRACVNENEKPFCSMTTLLPFTTSPRSLIGRISFQPIYGMAKGEKIKSKTAYIEWRRRWYPMSTYRFTC